MLPLKIIQCPKHRKIKRKLLAEIDNADSYQIDHEGDEGIGPVTDWTTDCREEREEYMRVYMMHAEQAILDVCRYEYGFEDGNIGHYWFQQYEETYTHSWHFHGGCLYHAIYYLELPEDAPPTMCRLPGGFEFTPNAKEGDILIMPSIVEHCSPPNRSAERKTIIAVNIDE